MMPFAICCGSIWETHEKARRSRLAIDDGALLEDLKLAAAHFEDDNAGSVGGASLRIEGKLAHYPFYGGFLKCILDLFGIGLACRSDRLRNQLQSVVCLRGELIGTIPVLCP